ncbi:MAG: mechanosensitive ion channel family protein [Bacteroidetes bacterium]|nr:mechanosensitive ion channel family protein [Bacteroidota bacterium]MCB9227740.1 mechanosensitive ion channel family protein [Chitinophagales bacterium]
MEYYKEFIVPIVYIIGTFIIAYIFNFFIKRALNSNVVSIRGDITKYKFLRHIIIAIVTLLGLGFAIHSVPELKTLANSMLAGAGIIAVAVGFASQEALGNVVSGIFLVLFKPFKINDRVEIGTKFGVVEDITLRHTIIRNLENKRIILPNSIVSKEIITNNDLVDEKVCVHLVIGISYDSNIDKAKTIIFEEAVKHPNLLDVRTPEDKKEKKPLVNTRVITLNESSVDIKAWLWAKDTPSAFEMKCDLLESIKKRFDKEGVEIPFPHRTIVQKAMKNG